jgi:hypothetical protein
VRNTIYWNPEVDLSPGESRVIEFYTSDQKGDFQVWIRGYGQNGRYHEYTLPFSVK